MKDHFCRGCGKKLEADWKVCPYCKIDIMEECSNCGKGIDINWHSCPSCGSQIHNTTIEEHKTQIYSDSTPDEAKTQIYSDEKNADFPIPEGPKVSSETPSSSVDKDKITAVAIVAIVGAIILVPIAFSMMPNADKYYKEGVANADKYYNEGITLYNQKKYDEAIAKFDKALEIDQNHAKSKEYSAYAWANKGLALYHQNKYSEAITCYDKAIAIDPNDAYAWYMKGYILSNTYIGKYDEDQINLAIMYFDKAIAIDPNYAYAWYMKGIALERCNRWAEARKCFDKARELGY